jgi:hypothetical protein
MSSDRPAWVKTILEMEGILNKQGRYYHPHWMAKHGLPMVPG